MPRPLILTEIDGHTINGATSYAVGFPEGSDYPHGVDLSLVSRRSAHPIFEAMSYQPWPFTLLIRAADAATAYATFCGNVENWFAPRRSGSTRVLKGTWLDNSTAAQLDIRVLSLSVIKDRIAVRNVQRVYYLAECQADYPFWEAVTATTSAANPATVTNNGNAPALPSIALTQATHVTRRACTVTGAGAGGGLVAYPVVFLLSDAVATATNIYVFVEGVSVPCYVDDPATANSRVWALIDTASDGTTATNVDVIYGAGLVNPLCGTLPQHGMRLDSSAACDNVIWAWDAWRAETYAARCGTWRPALTGNHQSSANASYAISASAASLTLALEAQGVYDNSADSLILVIGSQAATASALTNMSRQTTGLDGTNAQAYVRYREANNILWKNAWTTRANATVTTAIDLDNAVEIIVGLENDGGTADPSTLIIGGANVGLILASAPTVVVGAAVNEDRYNGTYVVGAYTLTFNDLLCPDGTLTIDCKEKSISNSVAGGIYGESDMLQFSDPDVWAALAAGANTITDSISAGDTITHRDTYS